MNFPSFTKNGVSDIFYNSFKPQRSGFRLWYQINNLYTIISLFTWHHKVFMLFYILLLTKVKNIWFKIKPSILFNFV